MRIKWLSCKLREAPQKLVHDFCGIPKWVWHGASFMDIWMPPNVWTAKNSLKLMSCRPACRIGRSNCLLTIIILNQCPWREVFFWKIYSTLLFLTPFSMVLRMLESGYRLVRGKHEIAVSHLLFKDDLRLLFTCSRFKCVVPAMKKGRTWTAVVLISQ